VRLRVRLEDKRPRAIRSGFFRDEREEGKGATFLTRRKRRSEFIASLLMNFIPCLKFAVMFQRDAVLLYCG